jgi:hypothetical protein
MDGGCDEWYEIQFKGKRAGSVHLKGEWQNRAQFHVMAISDKLEHSTYSEKLLHNAGLFGKCFSVQEAEAAEMELNRQSYSLLIFGVAIAYQFP